MTISISFITALWLVLLAYWAFSAIGAKKSLRTRDWSRQVGLRLAIIAIVLIALRVPIVRNELRTARFHLVNTDVLMAGIGVLLCALGVGLAIWARARLGRNWGMPMSVKENPELITAGPYALVRHPIYTGFLLAILGSAIAESSLWLVPFALIGAYFVHSARREEALMLAQFPNSFPAYKKRTKMMVPFIL